MSTDLLTSMRARLADAEADAERLRAAIAVLEGRNGATSEKPARRQRRSAPRPGQAIPAGKIIAALTEAPGLTTTTLAKRLDGDQSLILALLKDAEAEGVTRREGERRGTRWFVVTDEEKVTARAKQLAAQSTGAA